LEESSIVIATISFFPKAFPGGQRLIISSGTAIVKEHGLSIPVQNYYRENFRLSQL